MDIETDPVFHRQTDVHSLLNFADNIFDVFQHLFGIENGEIGHQIVQRKVIDNGAGEPGNFLLTQQRLHQLR